MKRMAYLMGAALVALVIIVPTAMAQGMMENTMMEGTTIMDNSMMQGNDMMMQQDPKMMQGGMMQKSQMMP